jgi:N-acetylglucosamine-6-phosphate deacetylase
MVGDTWHREPGEIQTAICEIAIHCKMTVDFAHFDPVPYTGN